MNKGKSIIAVGSIALDTLYTANGHRENIVGGSATYFGIAASQYTDVGLIGVVGKDFPQSAWKILNDYQIDIQNVQIEEGETFRWGGKYSDDFSARKTLFTELGVFANFYPKISDDYTNPEFIFLGNIQPDLQLAVIDQCSTSACIVSDTMNLWIDLSNDQLWKVIRGSDIFLLNDEEATQLTGLDDLTLAADQFLDYGPSTVIIKQGANGALIAQNHQKNNVPVFPLDKIIDPTGAGDTFAGGFVGHLAKYGKDDILNATIAGSAIASFTVSGFGVEGLLKANLDEIELRCQYIRNALR